MCGRVPQWGHLVLNFPLQGTVYCLFVFNGFYNNSNDWSVQMIYFFLMQFVESVFLETFPFLPGSQVYWHIIVYSILLLVFILVISPLSFFNLFESFLFSSLWSWIRTHLFFFPHCLFELYFIYFLSDHYYPFLLFTLDLASLFFHFFKLPVR